MALSKELCLRSDSKNSDSFSDCFLNEFQSKEDNYRRDSFCDRFCDDLYEDILQYLSLEDKLRLECVSKQFQRTVFQRQYNLYTNLNPKLHELFMKYKDSRIRSDHNYTYIEDQSLDSFKALLKKCPNITSIELDGSTYNWYHYNPDKLNRVFRIIIENCNNLSEINVLRDINDRNLREFHRRFGTKIKCSRSFRQLFELSRFPNIEKIEIKSEKLINGSIIPQLNLAKLRDLRLVFDQGQEHMLQTFIDTFPTLTHLKVCFSSRDENAIYKSLKNISNLKHLIHFHCIELCNNNNRIHGLIDQMANNCLNLKSIGCRYNLRQNSDISQLLSQLISFPALKRLNLFVMFFNNRDEFDINVNVNQFSFELFKGFSDITHLSLCFHWKQILKESILKEFDINLPKLQYLEIDGRFHTTPEGVKQMADILSRLSRLETLKLYFISGVDYNPIEEQITEKCRKIRKIQLIIPNH